jgi:hypothetical protein
MIIVGIDMSKNSPGVCVREGEKLTFLSFIRGAETRKIASHYATLRECDVKIVTNLRNCETKDYSESEVWKIEDSIVLAETIVENLPETVDMVGLEGFSYGSKGNSGLDIAGYAYSLRGALVKKYGKEKLCIFSPGNVKKTAGKGNANKEQIMDFFLREEKNDLLNNAFWKGIFEGEIEKKKPVDDLVDSYYVQECAFAHWKKIVCDDKN